MPYYCLIFKKIVKKQKGVQGKRLLLFPFPHILGSYLSFIVFGALANLSDISTHCAYILGALSVVSFVACIVFMVTAAKDKSDRPDCEREKEYLLPIFNDLRKERLAESECLEAIVTGLTFDLEQRHSARQRFDSLIGKLFSIGVIAPVSFMFGTTVNNVLSNSKIVSLENEFLAILKIGGFLFCFCLTASMLAWIGFKVYDTLTGIEHSRELLAIAQNVLFLVTHDKAWKKCLRYDKKANHKLQTQAESNDCSTENFTASHSQ